MQVTSRQSTATVTNSQLVLMDGRSIYLDFLGLVMRDLLPANQGDIEQIKVVRGPASATWGTNAMTGAVNIITRPTRQSVGTTVTMSGVWIGPGSRVRRWVRASGRCSARTRRSRGRPPIASDRWELNAGDIERWLELAAGTDGVARLDGVNYLVPVECPPGARQFEEWLFRDGERVR